MSGAEKVRVRVIGDEGREVEGLGATVGTVDFTLHEMGVIRAFE